ncbi:MAG: glycosyltransferase [Pseudomonadota bacterium]
MSDDGSYRLLIDASSDMAQGLCGVVARILQAATPSAFGFGQVELVVHAEDATDWPDIAWLTITRASGESGDNTKTDDHIQAELDNQPQTVLVSLNTMRFTHERSAVLMSDSASSVLTHQGDGGFLQRLKEKISARSALPEIDSASGIIALSCFAVAKTAQFKKMQHLIPLGVAPEFFSSLRRHRLVDEVTIENPFIWLAAADPASDSIDTTIKAVQILRDYGACIELKVLVPAPDEAHERGEEFNRSLEKRFRQLSFVELIDETQPEKLTGHFAAADGFVWGDRSDHSHAPMLRAMASGLPVVAPNAEMVKKHLGSKVRFFIQGDANDLANTLERSMADIHFRIIVSGRNHKSAMRYTFEKSAAELFRVVRAYAAADLSATASIEHRTG